MVETEVVGMSVEAKLILKGVEPFSIDVVEPVSVVTVV